MENKIAAYIFNRVGIPNMKKYLDLSSYRHKLVSGNISNVATPGYKSKDIAFHDEFKKMTEKGKSLAGVTTNPAHIPTGDHKLKPPKVSEAKVADGDINSVNIDTEIPHLAQNELMFSVGATMLQRKFETLRKVIQSE